MRLIDADAFIEENKDIIDCEIDHPKYQDTLRELINNAPTVARPHGEWTCISLLDDYVYVKCSECGQGTRLFRDSKNEFCCIRDVRDKIVACPYCGASMKEGESE